MTDHEWDSAFDVVVAGAGGAGLAAAIEAAEARRRKAADSLAEAESSLRDAQMAEREAERLSGEARELEIAAQLQPLLTKFNADRAAASPNQQALQQQAAQIQQIEAAGQRELQTILAPVGLSQAYVQEQIEDRLDTAVQAAARKKNITLILDASQGAVVYADATHNITQDVINEINAVLPSAQLVPPQGWVPREIREQQAAAAQAQGQQPAQPAQPQPSGR